jgi:rhodanese-related sulfurtransferase
VKARLEHADTASHPALLDVRLKYPYEHSTVRLPGAVRMPPDAVDAAKLSRERDIVLYDSDPDEVTSSAVAADLIRQGFRAAVLKGGIAEWAGANFPVDSKPAPKPAAPLAKS